MGSGERTFVGRNVLHFLDFPIRLFAGSNVLHASRANFSNLKMINFCQIINLGVLIWAKLITRWHAKIEIQRTEPGVKLIRRSEHYVFRPAVFTTSRWADWEYEHMRPNVSGHSTTTAQTQLGRGSRPTKHHPKMPRHKKTPAGTKKEAKIQN